MRPVTMQKFLGWKQRYKICQPHVSEIFCCLEALYALWKYYGVVCCSAIIFFDPTNEFAINDAAPHILYDITQLIHYPNRLRREAKMFACLASS